MNFIFCYAKQKCFISFLPAQNVQWTFCYEQTEVKINIHFNSRIFW